MIMILNLFLVTINTAILFHLCPEERLAVLDGNINEGTVILLFILYIIIKYAKKRPTFKYYC